LKALVKVEAEFGNLPDLIDKMISEKPGLRSQMEQGVIPWAPAYDGTVNNQLACFLYAFGLSHELREIHKSSDPYQALLDSLDQGLESQFPVGGDTQATVARIIGLLIGLTRTFDSLKVFGKYINELVDEGRFGNDKSFFDAIRIDPAVLSTSALQQRLSQAVALNDRVFISGLQSALNGKTKKHESQLNRVRFAIRALLDAGGLDIPDDELIELFERKLHLYAPGEDPAKALRKHIRRQKRMATTQKR